jgi:hypothetical protein
MQRHRQLRPARIDARGVSDRPVRIQPRTERNQRRVYRSASVRRRRIALIAVALAGTVLALGSALTPEGLRSASLPEVSHRIGDHLSIGGAADDGGAAGDGAAAGDAGSLKGVGQDDGYVAEGGSVSPFADDLPAIAKLDAPIRAALQQAARDAEGQGIEVLVTSGWRSASYQRLLARRAEREYGAEEARKLVLPPERSAHVQGSAVDVGRTDAADWMSRHGSTYGLCQIYSNELWHYELATAPGGRCPMQRSDASS